MEESRWNMRVPVSVPVRLDFADATTLTGVARDISFQGLYVRTDERPGVAQPSSPVVVTLPAGGDAARVLELPAMVVRTTGSGLGVLFFDYGDRQFDGIAEHIEAGFEARRPASARRNPL
ncbi:MAG TPA: PilZ domain-containing protein [Gammaproteobacteria bacterium]|nr:PilZ domain-containing protein [Gammaproteobacteria bacterium]